MAFATFSLHGVLHVLPESIPRISHIGLDPIVVLFALTLSVLTGLVCGAAPAFAALRVRVNDGLKQGGRSGSDGASHAGLRATLVVTEVAVSLVLLVAAGDLLRSFDKMRNVDPGFRPAHILVAAYGLPRNSYPNEKSAEAFSQRLLLRLQSQPGIVSAGITNVLPASGFTGTTGFVAEGPRDTGITSASLVTLYGNYFQAIGIPLLQGRFLSPQDDDKAPLAIAINQSLARHHWPKGDAIGKRLRIGTPKSESPWATIVGVVGDTKLGAPDSPDKEQFYVPVQQAIRLLGSFSSPDDIVADGGSIVLRTSLAPEQMTHVLRESVAAVDPLLALRQVQTMEKQLSRIEAPRRFSTSIITAFALGALLLSAIGIYAVIAFSVSLRSQEMAIRMALGSRRSELVRLVMSSGLQLALAGCGVGLVAAAAASRLLRSLLFNVDALDPLTLIVSLATMLTLALLACGLPARRAASANPVDALRSE